MKKCDVIDVQLESFFGSKLARKIQQLVNHELNQGRWVDGYDIAVSQGEIDNSDARKLLEIVLSQYPEWRINEAALRKVIEERLPQSIFASISWIVDDGGSFALSDSLRVARFEGSSLIWISPRISYDGINFESLTDGKLCGSAEFYGSHESPFSPFIFDFDSGALLLGKIVEHES